VTPRTLLGLEVAVEPAAWRSLGFAVHDGSVCSVDGVAIRLGAGHKVSAWSLDGVASGTTIDGLLTAYAPVGSAASAHPNGTVALDHLVVISPAPERIITALAEHGIEPRRRRHTDQYGPPFTQTFFKIGKASPSRSCRQSRARRSSRRPS
jgi:hypothetical protein